MSFETLFADLAARVFAGAAAEAEGGFDGALWHDIEAAGLDRLLLPEDQGGAGEAFQDAIGVMVAFGGAGAAVPMAETLAANWCLARLGIDVPAGPKSLLLEPDARGEFTGQGSDAVWRGRGVAYWAPCAAAAVAVTARHGGLVSAKGLVRGETVSGEPLAWIGPGDTLRVTALAPAEGLAERALALAALLDAAAIVGALERICELTIGHANTRTQFGRALSRFQAVQHMAARMASEAAAARAEVENAAAGIAGDNPLWATALAKARASEAAGLAAALAHQIHGAIGYTREYELHRHTRHVWTWRECRGNEHYWNARIGAAARRAGGAGLWAGLVDGLRV